MLLKQRYFRVGCWVVGDGGDVGGVDSSGCQS